MATSPTFGKTALLSLAVVSTANTNRDGTGTIVTLATGNAAGTVITEVVVAATGATTAGMVRLYLSSDSGSTWRAYAEIPVAAVTPSASAPAFQSRRQFRNLRLADASDLLGVATHNAETFHVTAHGAHLDA